MARGFRERRRRDSGRQRFAVLKWLLLIGGLVVLGLIAYAAGSELARDEVRRLQEQIGAVEADLAERTEEASALRAERDEAAAQLRQLQDRYDRDVPEGETREIFALVRDQLDAGVSKDRLRFLIRTAGETVPCGGDPNQKRFIVQTGTTRGQNDWVGFAGNTIIVRAKGKPVLAENGRPEAWFDENKPVTVLFFEIDGSESEATGILPLKHSLIRGEYEYRFVLTKAPTRGFLQVTAQRCQMPADQ